MRYALALLACCLWACGDDAGEGSSGSTTPSGGGGTTATSTADGGEGGIAGAGGTGGAGGGTGGSGGADPTTMDVVVAVGWQGLRLLSIDEGQTWCETGLMTDGHDDLFRGAGYHDGLFVGAHAGLTNDGAIWTTTNGYDWTALHATNDEPNLPPSPTGQWFGGAAYGNGTWLAAGGCGRLATSPDGVTWTEIPKFTQGCLHIRSLTFHDGEFVAGLDDDNWWSSSDLQSWSIHTPGAGSFVVTLESGLSGPVANRNYYQGRGVCLAGIGSPDFGIERSTNPDCTGGERVADTAHRPTTFLFGRAPIADFDRALTGDSLADCLGLP